MIKDIQWDKLDGHRQLLGDVGVDSGSICISDKADRDQIEFWTPDGDGRYAVYAQTINDRRCVVIDMDAITDYDLQAIRLKPLTTDWACPNCGAEEHSGGQSVDTTFIDCMNDHHHEIECPVVDDGLKIIPWSKA